MAITIATTLLSNQSILENIALVEEIDEQAAEIISGGQSVNFLNTGISSFEDDDDDIIPVNEDVPDPKDEHPKSFNQANFVFG